MSNAEKPRVLIAGAGIGGLTSALSLLKRGIDCDVYEQAPELREVGAGLWLSMNGVDVLSALGLKEELEQASIAATQRSIRLWNTGGTWPLYKAPGDASQHQPILLLRAHLMNILADALRRLKPNAIHFDAHCIGYTQDEGSVTALFRDGSKIVGSTLIGADGAHSKVRTQMLGTVESHFTNAIAWRGLTQADRLLPHQHEHVVSTWIGPTAHITAYPVRWKNTELMTFSGQVEHHKWAAESWSEKGSVEECLKDFENWHPDIVDVIRNCDSLYKWGLFVRKALERWSDGRVTLVGDAAHSMPPYMGQGVNMAAEDACVLTRCLDEHLDDPATAFVQYEKSRMDRTTKVAQASIAMQTVFHHKALGAVDTASQYIQTQWSRQANADRYNWIYEYDATSVPLSA